MSFHGFLLLAVFIVIIILIAKQHGNRAIIALGGAVICYIILFFAEQAEPTLILDFIFGTSEDNYANFNSILLILGIITIIDITKDSGFFQFIAFTLIKRTKGHPAKLFLVVSCLTLVLAMFIDNILVLIILIPLIISISRMLKINPIPYLLSTAILVNICGTVFSFSSVANILITGYAHISAMEFFLGVGIISMIVAGATILFLYVIIRGQLNQSAHDINFLLEFDPWNFIPNKSLMYKSATIFIITLACLIFIPQEVFPSDLIALIGMFVLIIISKLDTDELIKDFDLELFLYLIGISVVTGAINHSGVAMYLGDLLRVVSFDNPSAITLSVLWISAFASIGVDNVPMTQIFLPVIRDLTADLSLVQAHQSYFALTIGIGWGDSLTPFGDNILVMKVAAQNDVQVPVKDFFKIGFVSGIFQLYLAMIFFTIAESPISAILMTVILLCVIVILVLILRLKQHWRLKKACHPPEISK